MSRLGGSQAIGHRHAEGTQVGLRVRSVTGRQRPQPLGQQLPDAGPDQRLGHQAPLGDADDRACKSVHRPLSGSRCIRCAAGDGSDIIIAAVPLYA